MAFGTAESLFFAFIIIPILIVVGTFYSILYLIRAAKEKPSNEEIDEIADELNKLAELHQRGILTDEEFYKQKKKLLKR